MKITVFLPILLAFSLFSTCLAENKKINYPENLWMGIVGEAADQGYEGMYAVACVYRNRINRGMSLGCVAIRKKDLLKFISAQPKRTKMQAKRIVKLVFEEKRPDITNGATHYENTEEFGFPWWAAEMETIKIIGDHTFFKKSE